MRRATRWLGLVALGLALLPAGVRAEAGPGRPLPDFTLASLDGLAVRSDRLPRPGAWLLIYVQDDCFACDSLLDLLQDPELSRALAGLVVVGRGAAGDVARLAARFGHLGPAPWHADPDGTAAARLALAGAPVVLGMRGATIEWRVSGLLPGAGELRSILAAWASR